MRQPYRDLFSLVAAAIGQPLCLTADRQAGPAIGAARLARAAVGGPLMTKRQGRDSLPAVPVDPQLRDQLERKKVLFREHTRLSAKEIA